MYKQLTTSNTNLDLSRVHWIKNDVTDNYFWFILKFKQYENANNVIFVYFEKKPHLLVEEANST